MRKKITALHIFIVLFLVLMLNNTEATEIDTTAFYNNTISGEIVEFEDDFNRADSTTIGNGWTQIGCSVTINIVSNYLDMEHTSACANQNFPEIHHDIVDATIFEWDWYDVNDYQYFLEFRIRDASDNLLFRISQDWNSKIIKYYDGSSWNTIDSYSVNTWYSMKTVFHDHNDSMDVYIDDVYKLNFATQYSGSISASDLDFIEFYQLGDYDERRIDNVVLSYETDLQYDYFNTSDDSEFDKIWFNFTGTNCDSEDINVSTDNATFEALSGDIYHVFSSSTDEFYTRTDTSDCENIAMTLTNSSQLSTQNITWSTTGGFTSTELVFNQVMDFIQANVTDGDGANITITKPDNTIAVDNAVMTNVSDIYTYGTDFTLDVAGQWKINVTGYTDTATASDVAYFNVSTKNVSILDGWYGCTNDTIPSSTEVLYHKNYNCNLLEFVSQADEINTDWTDILTAINDSIDSNLKVGLNFVCSVDLNNSDDIALIQSNITEYLDDLTTSDYSEAIIYVSFQLPDNHTGYSDTDKTDFLNDIALTTTQATNNEFPIYSQNYNSSGLDDSYITYTTLQYSTPDSQEYVISRENVLFRTSTYLNRVYHWFSAEISSFVESFQDDFIDNLRSTPDTSVTIATPEVGYLTNGDLIVFNNESTAQTISIDATNDTTVSGKDVWDSTNKRLIEADTDLVFDVLVDAYDSALLFFENLDSIRLSSSNTATLYQTEEDEASIVFNYTDDTLDGNWLLDNFADEIKWNGFDPSYRQNKFITYYGWINVSYVTDWDRYDIVILDDENPDIVKDLIADTTDTEFYFYISVADYSNTDAWNSAKETEVDNIIALNESERINVFVDGLDMGIGGDNFSSRMKDLVDYIKITKDRKVGLNTYTAYASFCTWPRPDGFCMKESCVRRWNGANAGNPDSYTWEDWDLEIERAEWYKSHNVDVVCQAFDNRTADTHELSNWTNVKNGYFASLILGYDKYYVSQPDFNYAHDMYLYDVGENLAQSFSTDDSETYYRRYSNGVVYYNTSSNEGWIDDNREYSLQVCFKLYDSSDGASDEDMDWEFRINNVTTDDNYQYSIPAETIVAGVWDWYCVDIDDEHKSDTGSYKIEASTSNAGTIADGIFVGYSDYDNAGIHSWYSDTAGSPVWSNYPQDRNWDVSIIVNETTQASLDTMTDVITQTDGLVAGKYNITIMADDDYDVEIWSNPVEVELYRNLSYWDGSERQKLYPRNTTTCDSDNPLFNETTIGSEIFKSCIEDGENGTIVRVAPPSLSARTFMVELIDTEAPLIENLSLNPELNISYFNNYNISVDVTDNVGINFVNMSYKGYNIENNSCWQYYVNGSCASPIEEYNLTYISGNTYSKTPIRPDEIYPEISFADDSVFWYNEPDFIDTYSNSYHILEFNNNFTVNGYLEGLLGDEINLSNKFWIVVYSEENAESKAWNLSYRDSSLCNSTNWWVGSESGYTTTLQSGCPDVHVHFVRHEDETILNVEVDATPQSTTLDDLKIYLFSNTTEITDFDSAWIGSDKGVLLNTINIDESKHHEHTANSSHYLTRASLLSSTNEVSDGILLDACATDFDGNENCTTSTSFFGETPNFAPNTNKITSPDVNETLDGNITISWDTFVDPNNDAVTYDVFLLDSGKHLRKTISENQSTKTVVWNRVSVTDGDYYIRVQGCDNRTPELCSNETMTETFTLLTPPSSANLTRPLNRTVFSSGTEAVLNLTSQRADNYSLYINDVFNKTLFLNGTGHLNNSEFNMTPNNEYAWYIVSHNLVGTNTSDTSYFARLDNYTIGDTLFNEVVGQEASYQLSTVVLGSIATRTYTAKISVSDDLLDEIDTLYYIPKTRLTDYSDSLSETYSLNTTDTYTFSNETDNLLFSLENLSSSDYQITFTYNSTYTAPSSSDMSGGVVTDDITPPYFVVEDIPLFVSTGSKFNIEARFYYDDSLERPDSFEAFFIIGDKYEEITDVTTETNGIYNVNVDLTGYTSGEYTLYLRAKEGSETAEYYDEFKIRSIEELKPEDFSDNLNMLDFSDVRVKAIFGSIAILIILFLIAILLSRKK